MAEEKNALIPQETREKLMEVLIHCADIKELKITTDEEDNACSRIVGELVASKKELETARKALVGPLNAQVKDINAEFKAVTSKVENAITVTKRGMGKYYQAKEAARVKKQQEEQAKADEARRKQEEAERKEREKAEKYREEGRTEMADKADARADEHAEIAETTVAEVVEQKKPDNTVYVDKWVAEEDDKKAAVMACVENPMLIEAVSLNLKVLERVRAATKTDLPIPGITWKKTTVVKTMSKGR